MTWVLLLLLPVSLGVPTLAQEEICFVGGECVEPELVGATETDNAQDCLDFCKTQAGCNYFTWYGDQGGICMLSADCPSVSQGACNDCYAGSVTCSDVTCWDYGKL